MKKILFYAVLCMPLQLTAIQKQQLTKLTGIKPEHKIDKNMQRAVRLMQHLKLAAPAAVQKPKISSDTQATYDWKAIQEQHDCILLIMEQG